MPLDRVVASTTGSIGSPGTSRYSVPSPCSSRLDIDPAHSRPCGSTRQSLSRLPSFDSSTVATVRRVPSSSSSTMSCPTATTTPPGARGSTALTSPPRTVVRALGAPGRHT
jgi:hypothetical protein